MSLEIDLSNRILFLSHLSLVKVSLIYKNIVNSVIKKIMIWLRKIIVLSDANIKTIIANRSINHNLSSLTSTGLYPSSHQSF